MARRMTGGKCVKDAESDVYRHVQRRKYNVKKDNNHTRKWTNKTNKHKKDDYIDKHLLTATPSIPSYRPFYSIHVGKGNNDNCKGQICKDTGTFQKAGEQERRSRTPFDLTTLFIIIVSEERPY